MLHRVCRSGDLKSISEAILNHKSEINQKDEGVKFKQLGWTALYRAVICDQYEVCEALLQNGADPNIPNNLGQIPLHSACEGGNYSLASLLLSYSSDCNIQSCTGDSPLHYASSKGDFFIVKLLLENGALPNLTNKVSHNQLGLTAMDLAIEGSFKECIEIFKQFGAEISENTTKKASVSSNDLRSSDQELKAVYLTSKSEDISEVESSPHIYELFNTFGGLSSAIQESKKTEKMMLFDWLCENGLNELFDVLVDSGYDDHIVMARQMLTSMPIKMKNLAEIGIFKTGHQRRLLFCLEEEGKNRKMMKRDSLRQDFQPGIKEILQDLGMTCYLKNFEDAGYDDYSTITRMNSSKWALNEHILKNELKIYDFHEIQKFLRRVQQDSSVKAEAGILFEDSKNVACSRCVLM